MPSFPPASLKTEDNPLDGKGSKSQMELKLYDLCRQAVEEQGLELYDLDYRESSGFLRVMIQNPKDLKGQGASIDDCVAVSRILTPLMDREEWVPEKRTLEVSSPGLDRPLKSIKHFRDSIGKRIVVKLNSSQGRGRINGSLQDVKGDRIQMEVEGVSMGIPLGHIKTAHWELLV
ncbi:MAG: ribosome maturation factor RimP [Bacteriovoracales bacterium]|nr:ribosome maturation factor RimP [Bacteriovoracales bacterium]